MKKNKKIGILAILVLVFSISIFGGIGLANRNQVKAATELQMAKTAYESALAAASTMLSISLLDFLS